MRIAATLLTLIAVTAMSAPAAEAKTSCGTIRKDVDNSGGTEPLKTYRLEGRISCSEVRRLAKRFYKNVAAAGRVGWVCAMFSWDLTCGRAKNGRKVTFRAVPGWRSRASAAARTYCGTIRKEVDDTARGKDPLKTYRVTGRISCAQVRRLSLRYYKNLVAARRSSWACSMFNVWQLSCNRRDDAFIARPGW